MEESFTKEENEALRQEIHELKRKLQIYQKTAHELSEELDRTYAELAQTRTGYAKQQKLHDHLIDKMKEELEKQNGAMNESVVATPKTPMKLPVEKPAPDDQHWQKLQAQYEEEIDVLTNGLSTIKQQFSTANSEISELTAIIILLREQLECEKGNLQTKEQEITELRELLESTQQRNAVLSAELAKIRSEPDQASAKGNSLFAEVADQRKAIMTKYTQLKKCHVQLKAQYEKYSKTIGELSNEQDYAVKLYRECITLINSAQTQRTKELDEQVKNLHQHLDRAKCRISYLENQMASQSDEWVSLLLEHKREEIDYLSVRIFGHYYKEREALEMYEDMVKRASSWRIEAQQMKLKLLGIGVPSIIPSINEGATPSDTEDAEQCAGKADDAGPHHDDGAPQ